MSPDTFRVVLAICAVVIASTLLGGLLGIGTDLHDLVGVARHIRRCP